MQTPVYLGADLGGTNLRIGLRLAGAPELLDVETVPASRDWEARDLVSLLSDVWARAAARHNDGESRPGGVGFGLTGDIDCEAGTCHSMKRFPRLEGVPLRELLREQFDVSVHVINDGLAAAIAERSAGAGTECAEFVLVTLGTGVGGGVVTGGKVLLGPRGRAGKVGHQILEIDGPVHCHCGLRGCWQSFVARQGVEHRARQAARLHPRSRLATEAVTEESVDLALVARLAAADEEASRTVMEETGRYLGIGLANLAKIFAPELFLVGGGIAEDNPVLFATAQRVVREFVVNPYESVPVLPARFGKEAGVLGATFLAELGL